jgi:hypothetical protein
LPNLNAPRTAIRPTDYPKLKVALENVDELIEKIEAAEEAEEEVKLSSEERRFYEAYDEHWVHADNRTTLTGYICKVLVGSLKG